ncbi:MAG: LacI family transcriptional regulator [Telmatospirillum sp.]|nr:LacI family transcriptional regulator [Telmatospirillum sp.]
MKTPKGDPASRAKAPTIRDVAHLARTSIATVSYVLNNKDRYLRPELRDRVLEAAKTLGYVKNAVASSLKGKQRGIVAVMVPQFGNNFFTRICVEIEAVARRAGFVVIICNSDENPGQEISTLERLVSQKIDGCVLCPALSQTESTRLLERHRVPTVILERPLGDIIPDQDFVGHDNYQSGYMATRHLLEAGHRAIAFFGWDSPIPNVNHRVDGYKAALADFGITPEPDWVHLDDLSLDAGRRRAQQVPFDRITGIVLGHHLGVAQGLLQHLRERRLHWPDDLSVVMIGTPEWYDLIEPPLCCIERPESEMGRQAALLLLEKVRDPQHRGPQTILPVTFIPGSSVRQIPPTTISTGS